MRYICLVVLAALLCVSVGWAQGETASQEESRSGSDVALRWAVLVDLRESNTTRELLADALRRYVATAMNETGRRLFANAPVILNSNGNLLYALANMTALLSNPATVPDVVFLLETADVSASVADLLRKSSTTAHVLLVSAHASGGDLCNAAANPRTMCVAPAATVAVRALLETAASMLNWQSVAVVLRNDGYGEAMHAALSAELRQASVAPTVVTQLFMNAGTTSDEDDALLAQLLQHRPRALVCFVDDDQMRRLHAAVERAGASVFLLGAQEALNVVSDLVTTDDVSDSSTQTPLPWGALLVPTYATPASLRDKGYWPSSNTVPPLSHHGALVVSHLMDGMQLVAQAGGTGSMTRLRAQHVDGLTGTVAFDPVTHERMPCAFAIVNANFTIDNALATWRLTRNGDAAVRTSPNPRALATLVPPSPLHAVTVCLTAAATCAEVSMLAAVLYTLELLRQADTPTAIPVSYLPLALNTGSSGVSGLASLIPVARGCTVVVGPGRANTVVAFAPVVNEFALTEIEYNAASELPMLEGPSFSSLSRTIPTERVSARGYGEVCAHFAWERVILVAYEDPFGLARADAVRDAMVHRNIHVEKRYTVADLRKETIVSVLDEIYRTAVSRIVYLLLPLSGDAADMFYHLIDELTYLHNYVFFLSQELCLHGYTHPDARARLQSSICTHAAVDTGALTELNARLTASPALTARARTVLSDGGFESEVARCELGQVAAFAGFAVDAGYVVHGAVTQALAQNVTLNVSAHLLPLVRQRRFRGLTGVFDVDERGRRTWAAYSADIQVEDRVIDFATYDPQRKPSLQVNTTVPPWRWMTNETAVPLDTFRDISFVLGNTVSASPGTIVLSVLGFIGTIAVFFFCYRHYKVQKLIELSLEGNDVPVTEDELRRLRGIKADV